MAKREKRKRRSEAEWLAPALGSTLSLKQPHKFISKSKMEERGELKVLSLPAAPAFGLIRRGCSPANLGTARYAMAARRAQPAAGRGWRAQQTKASGPGDQARPRVHLSS